MVATPKAHELKNADYSTPSAECDMVMKGGITSGVIYPLAVCQLAMEHRLRNIGGASAGAIAAGAAAAAEYGRQSGGFQKLAAVPSTVGQNLDRLFQPTSRTKPAMRVLLAMLRPGNGIVKAAGAIVSLLRWRLSWFLLGFATVGGICLASVVATLGMPVETGQWPRLLMSWALLAVTLALPAGLLAAILGLLVLVLKRAPENCYGLANGMTTDPSKGEALTPWLHDQIQNIAGRKGGRKPLTFGDLWGEAATKAWRLSGEGPSAAGGCSKGGGVRLHPNIVLEVMTTNLTEGMPYRIPFEGRRFAFCPRCFSDLFPNDVVAHMVKTGSEPEVGDDGTAVCKLHDQPTALKQLPAAPDFPIVVAVRMSLSFPVLISAVPLYKRDFNRRDGERNWVPHWFSDGGIGSNFPIHLFDSPWPMRPTFGIDLQPTHPDYPNSEFYLHKQGQRAQPRTLPITSVSDFLRRIFTTMQNWRDNSFALMPGYSDRIVKIYQWEHEGGMNLMMPAGVIAELAERGGKAAAEFAKFNFAYHRWERYRVAMSEMDRLLTGLHDRYTTATDIGLPSYRDFIATYQTTSYVPDSAWRDGDRMNTKLLMDVACQWIAGGNAAGEEAPSPRPVLRLESRQIESRSDTSD